MPGMQRLAAGHLGINAASQPSGDDVDDLRTFIQMVYKGRRRAKTRVFELG